MTSATDELRKSLDFMRIWISEDAHLGESAISRELEKAEGLRKLDAIEQAIAATLGNDASAVRLADRLRGIADEMRSVGASSMTPQELLACYASDVNKVADSLMFAATLGSGTCHDQAAPSAKRFCCSMCCTTDAQKNPLFCHGCGRKVEQ